MSFVNLNIFKLQSYINFAVYTVIFFMRGMYRWPTTFSLQCNVLNLTFHFECDECGDNVLHHSILFHISFKKTYFGVYFVAHFYHIFRPSLYYCILSMPLSCFSCRGHLAVKPEESTLLKLRGMLRGILGRIIQSLVKQRHIRSAERQNKKKTELLHSRNRSKPIFNIKDNSITICMIP